MIEMALMSIAVILLGLLTGAHHMYIKYRKLYYTELDKRLKYEVEVKNLVLEHTAVADELQFNAYSR